MKSFKLGFRNCSVPEQLNICQRVVRSIAGLPEAQCASAKRVAVGDAVAAASASHERVQSLKSALRAEVTHRSALLRTAREKVKQVCNHVSANVSSDPAKVLAAGMELQAPKSPVGVPAAPGKLRAEAHELDGCVRLRWERPLRRCIFLVEMTTDPSTQSGWAQCEVTGRQSCIIKGLTPGMKYWFRVRAVNAHGESPWSDPASARVK